MASTSDRDEDFDKLMGDEHDSDIPDVTLDESSDSDADSAPRRSSPLEDKKRKKDQTTEQPAKKISLPESLNWENDPMVQDVLAAKRREDQVAKTERELRADELKWEKDEKEIADATHRANERMKLDDHILSTTGWADKEYFSWPPPADGSMFGKLSIPKIQEKTNDRELMTYNSIMNMKHCDSKTITDMVSWLTNIVFKKYLINKNKYSPVDMVLCQILFRMISYHSDLKVVSAAFDVYQSFIANQTSESDIGCPIDLMEVERPKEHDAELCWTPMVREVLAVFHQYGGSVNNATKSPSTLTSPASDSSDLTSSPSSASSTLDLGERDDEKDDEKGKETDEDADMQKAIRLSLQLESPPPSPPPSEKSEAPSGKSEASSSVWPVLSSISSSSARPSSSSSSSFLGRPSSSSGRPSSSSGRPSSSSSSRPPSSASSSSSSGRSNLLSNSSSSSSRSLFNVPSSFSFGGMPFPLYNYAKLIDLIGLLLRYRPDEFQLGDCQTLFHVLCRCRLDKTVYEESCSTENCMKLVLLTCSEFGEEQLFSLCDIMLSGKVSRSLEDHDILIKAISSHHPFAQKFVRVAAYQAILKHVLPIYDVPKAIECAGQLNMKRLMTLVDDMDIKDDPKDIYRKKENETSSLISLLSYACGSVKDCMEDKESYHEFMRKLQSIGSQLPVVSNLRHDLGQFRMQFHHAIHMKTSL